MTDYWKRENNGFARSRTAASPPICEVPVPLSSRMRIRFVKPATSCHSLQTTAALSHVSFSHPHSELSNATVLIPLPSFSVPLSHVMIYDPTTANYPSWIRGGTHPMAKSAIQACIYSHIYALRALYSELPRCVIAWVALEPFLFRVAGSPQLC